MMGRSTVFLLAACAMLACSSPSPSGEVQTSPDAGDQTPNPDPVPTKVVLVILDDVGSISMGAYADYWGAKVQDDGESWRPERTAPTPNIDRICSSGLRFTEAWSHSTCSPTRASILTGRQPARTGIGAPCGTGTNEIRPDEPTLPRVIKTIAPDYGLGNVGKWHLGIGDAIGGEAAPNTMGWDHFAGILRGDADYFSWRRTENGVTEPTTNYSTSQITDDAIAFVQSLRADQPYLLWVAYNAPHTPLHRPPAELHSYDDLPEAVDPDRDLDYFEAMLEATDTELGRLLRALPDNEA